MIDFSTVTGITVPEGVVTKITSGGVVLWELSDQPSSGNVILEVEKITSDTYANSTTYSSEEFLLLDIYPKTNGTVSVTYGDLTKTITDTSGADEPSSQQVFFGTFKGVSDEVATPTSGTLTISGDYRGFAIDAFNSAKSTTVYRGCVVSVVDWGNAEIIPHSAFRGCTSLASITIPDSVTSIGDYAFRDCTSLASIDIPSGVTTIGSNAFNNCTSLASITIPSSVTSIGNYAFNGCTSLASITIPSSVTSISGHTFFDCTSLASITIPSSVTSIGYYAFYGCTSLASITIPDSVTSIGNSAFYLASGNTRIVTMLPTTPPTLGGDTVFDEVGTNKIIVPAGCGATYKAAEYWSEYADYITEASA